MPFRAWLAILRLVRTGTHLQTLNSLCDASCSELTLASSSVLRELQECLGGATSATQRGAQSKKFTLHIWQIQKLCGVGPHKNGTLWPDLLALQDALKHVHEYIDNIEYKVRGLSENLAVAAGVDVKALSAAGVQVSKDVAPENPDGKILIHQDAIEDVHLREAFGCRLWGWDWETIARTSYPLERNKPDPADPVAVICSATYHQGPVSALRRDHIEALFRDPRLRAVGILFADVVASNEGRIFVRSPGTHAAFATSNDLAYTSGTNIVIADTIVEPSESLVYEAMAVVIERAMPTRTDIEERELDEVLRKDIEWRKAARIREVPQDRNRYSDADLDSSRIRHILYYGTRLAAEDTDGDLARVAPNLHCYFKEHLQPFLELKANDSVFSKFNLPPLETKKSRHPTIGQHELVKQLLSNIDSWDIKTDKGKN